MIPDELIETAWRAYVWGNNTQAIQNELDHLDLRGPMPPPPDTRQSVIAAIQAVAADIWDEGFEVGESNGYAIGRDIDTDENTDNPYRASETA